MPPILPFEQPAASLLNVSADLTRRGFVLGGTATLLGLVGCSATGIGAGAGQSSAGDRTVTTSLGTYAIPTEPQRVIAIDSRLGLEPGVALELPMIGYSYGQAEPWVPIGVDVPLLKSPPSIEEIAAMAPDLILCTDVGADSELWPLKKLHEIAPTLPLDYTKPWRSNLQQLIDWLGWVDTERATKAMTGYDARVAEVKSSHATTIADATIAIVQYSEDGVRASAAAFTSQQVAADLGVQVAEIEGALSSDGRTLALISKERYDVFDHADAMLVTSDAATAKTVEADKVWQRIPAVAAGHVVYSEGNINYGSIYTATKGLDLFDQLLTSMTA